MASGREIRSYDYVNHPYDRVRDALKQNALAIFQSATKEVRIRRAMDRASILRALANDSIAAYTMKSVRRPAKKSAAGPPAQPTRMGVATGRVVHQVGNVSPRA